MEMETRSSAKERVEATSISVNNIRMTIDLIFIPQGRISMLLNKFSSYKT
jgi:hypothetical protein